MIDDNEKAYRRQHWSEVAPAYAKKWRDPESAFYKELEAELLKEFVNPGPGLQILDVCCGAGRNTLPMAKLGANMCGLDAATGMIYETRTSANESGLKNVILVNGDVCRLPFPNNVFDAAIGTRFMYMMDKDMKRALLAELHRVLKPEAILVLQFNAGFWGIKHELKDVIRGKMPRFRGRYLWPGQVDNLFQGFRVERLVGVKLPWLAAVSRHIGDRTARFLNKLLRFPGFCYLSAYMVVKAKRMGS